GSSCGWWGSVAAPAGTGSSRPPRTASQPSAPTGTTTASRSATLAACWCSPWTATASAPSPGSTTARCPTSACRPRCPPTHENRPDNAGAGTPRAADSRMVRLVNETPPPVHRPRPGRVARHVTANLVSRLPDLQLGHDLAPVTLDPITRYRLLDGTVLVLDDRLQPAGRLSVDL